MSNEISIIHLAPPLTITEEPKPLIEEYEDWFKKKFGIDLSERSVEITFQLNIRAASSAVEDHKFFKELIQNLRACYELGLTKCD